MSKVFGPETWRLRRAGFGIVQLHAGNDTATCPQKIKWHGNHSAGLDFKHRIKQLALTRVFPDFIFQERLFARENHAYESGIERLLEFAHEARGVRAGVPGGHEKFAGLIDEPNSAFVRSGLGKSAFERLAHERIEQ